MMSPQLEIEGDFEAEALVNIDPSRSGVRLQTTFIQEVKHNFNVVKNALKINLSGMTLPGNRISTTR